MSFLDAFLFPLTFITALGCGLMAGTFFAFSNFVMKALARLPASRGVAAMQSINVVVLNPVFLAIFLGSGVICLLLLVHAAARWEYADAVWRMAGAALYIVGNVIVTMTCNVPRNDALAEIDPSSPTAESAWSTYVAGWTRWNHVRTVTALAAAASLMMALLKQ